VRKGSCGYGHEPAMARAPALGLLLLAACSPEVLLATNPSATGGAGAAGSAGLAGSGGISGVAGEAPDDGGEAGAASEPVEPPRLLADSVADFALVQGEQGWYYGYDDGTSDAFTLMTRLSVITTYTPVSGDVWDCWANDSAHWTQLFQLGGHPNGVDTSPPSVPLLERAVRRWVSTYSGDVTISGELAKIDVTPGGSTGIDASVIVDGAVLYSAFIGGEDGGGLSYEVDARLDVGSKVDFVLDPHESSDHHDLTRFTGIIERAAQAPSP
jgi:hypothetical protein